MIYILLPVVLVFALVGAIVGWRRGTANIHDPPGKYDFPGGMTRREHLRELSYKQRRLRIPLTLAYSMIGGMLGFALLMAYAVFIRR